MNTKNNAFCLKERFFGITLVLGLLFSLNLSAVLSIPKLGEIEDEFSVTWGEKSFDCKLSLDSEQKLTLTVTPLGQASPPQYYILHNNLTESLAISISNMRIDEQKKYARYIIALVASIVVLPVYPHSPDLTLPACANTTYNEVGIHVSLSGLKSSETSAYLTINITELSSRLSFSVTINGLNEEGLSQALLVQFHEDWVVTEDYKKADYTWFKDFESKDKRPFFHFGSH